ncbi:DUF3300 domain-containing protein [Paraburkholderia sp. SARCC-3016]|nr:DUF3300 domain-containing protein [Paraburkholderia sp. SARCC-3016]MDQ7980556.1 DUF3300 domain-containing protein [Paraburkholderia sp. SARCC-3016]
MPITASAQGTVKLSKQQLDSLTAPIALYPDALLAQVLMAATFPDEVQAAAQWSKANPQQKGDDAVKAVASKPWDPSVQSLVAFPQVLATMASKPEWVSQLGDAFLAQPNDVMNSVQQLRKQAQQAGHLKSNEQQKVVVDQDTIQIEPANPQIVYVPTYNPTVVYGPWLYPAYPPMYIPPPPGYALASGFATGLAFGAGIAVTNALWGGCNWHTGSVNVNVNRYNNLNVNNRLSTASDTANWNRNANFSNRSANFSSVQHNAYRGYDASREQAMQTLQSRTGENLSGSASQRFQDMQRGGGAGYNDLRNSAQNVNRDNAFRGAGDGNAERLDTQRGMDSHNTYAADNFGGREFGGGERSGGGDFDSGRFGGGGGFDSGRFRGGGGFGGGGGRFRR